MLPSPAGGRDLVPAQGCESDGTARSHPPRGSRAGDFSPRIAARVIKTFRGLAPDEETPFTALTERELEVLKLIAKGYSNDKIAEQLVISVGTVKGHVSNILSKLHLVDRTQAAAYAWQEGIVRREE